MKNLLILAALVMSGCATVPYEIQGIHVGDTFDLHTRENTSCTITVDNILTKVVRNGTAKPLNPGHICGEASCTEPQIAPKYVCVSFEAVRVERPKRNEMLMERPTRDRN